MKKISTLDIFWSGFKIKFINTSWNFERLQNIGFIFSIYNLLKKIYANNAAGLKYAVKRHLSFFNTHVFFASAVLGVMIKMEENLDDSNPDKKNEEIETMKLGIMGPLAAIGDNLFWSGIRPFALMIGAGSIYLGGTGPKAFLWAVFMSLMLYNVPRVSIKYYLLFKAYYDHERLLGFVQKIKFQEIMKSIKLMGTIFVAGIMAGYLEKKNIDFFKPDWLEDLVFLGVFVLSRMFLKRKTSITHIFIALIVFSIIISYMIN
ncbi:MAG: PTS system mannose/fructose/sorbose family transporter subunit IID [bacterium]